MMWGKGETSFHAEKKFLLSPTPPSHFKKSGELFVFWLFGITVLKKYPAYLGKFS
jgi:hypothetical protein